MHSPETIQPLLVLLSDSPARIKAMTSVVEPERLLKRSTEEPWSVFDVLVHLRACADDWGVIILRFVDEDHPAIRYKSPRSSMKKSVYQNATWAEAIDAFTAERAKLLEVLRALDAAG